MPVSPLDNAEGPLRVRLSSHGRELRDSARLLMSVMVHQAVNTPAKATLAFADSDPLMSGFPLFDAAEFEPGAAIAVEAGYGSGASAIFSGILVSYGLRLGGDGQARLVIECRDTVPAAPRRSDGGVALTVTYGESLIALDAALDAGCRFDEGQPKAQDTVGLTRQRGRMRFQGTAAAVPGGLIELKGLGTRFAGIVRADRVSHQIDSDGWTTEVEFGAPPEQIAEPPDPIPPHGRQVVVLSDEDRSITLADEHGNRVRLDAAGITLQSPKDITIGAKGALVASAAGALTLESQSNVAIDGVSVTARGSASAEVSAAGRTTVKGAIVMIN